jgi:hypothetical protein
VFNCPRLQSMRRFGRHQSNRRCTTCCAAFILLIVQEFSPGVQQQLKPLSLGVCIPGSPGAHGWVTRHARCALDRSACRQYRRLGFGSDSLVRKAVMSFIVFDTRPLDDSKLRVLNSHSMYFIEDILTSHIVRKKLTVKDVDYMHVSKVRCLEILRKLFL